MRVLLTSNASYDPPRGGSTRSNLIWLSHLADVGHACRVVCAGADNANATSASGIEIASVHRLSRRTSVLSDHIREFKPDWVLVSSEDLSHVALAGGPSDSREKSTGVSCAYTAVVSVRPRKLASRSAGRGNRPQLRGSASQSASQWRDYIKEHCGATATVIHPPMYGEPPYPRFGSFEKATC